MVNFDPKHDIPSLRGKTILITGGTAGLGRSTIFLLGPSSPSHIIFTGRSQSSADTVLSTFRAQFPSTTITFLPLDLSSLASIQAATTALLPSLPRLDLLLLNAGIMAVPPSLSTDGYEIQFATNHLGHALLTKFVLPTLQRTAQLPDSDVRIVIYTSDFSERPPKGGIRFDTLRTTQDDGRLGAWRRYAQSKLANILYARELARRVPEVLTVAIHPGVAFTGLQRDVGWMQGRVMGAVMKRVMGSVEEVSLNGIWAGTAPREGKEEKGKGRERLGMVKSGGYYKPVGVRDGKKRWYGTDDELAGRLWEWTEKELEEWVGEKEK